MILTYKDMIPMERAHQELSNGVDRISLDQLVREILRKNDEKKVVNRSFSTLDCEGNSG